MKDFIKICGALASIGSLVMLVIIANHIARQISEEEYEYEEVEVDDDEEGLQDIDKTDYPQE